MSHPYLNSDVFITCAVTGAGDSTSKSDKVPVTPKQIADDAIAAAKAGAAVAHIHVRDPETGAPSRKVEYYREVVERVRESDTDVVLNLTTGMGGDLVLGSAEQPLPLNEAETDMAGATERLAHIHALKPEICTLDCGTINFAAGGDYIMTNTPHTVREMAKQIRDAGVRPEIEVFDFGQLVLAKDLYKDGLLEDPVLVQLCMGIPYGTPDDPQTLVNLASQVPEGWTYSAFSIGRMQLPYVAMAALAGGNVRVGLEDNIYLQKGVLASNADLVERARTILEAMNLNVMEPARVREKLQLRKAG
jgi:uncharacterized protein (DUF849 family)